MKSQPQIIDLTKSQTPADLKPIELVACLQDYDYKDKSYRFQSDISDYSYFTNKAKTIKKLALLDGDGYRTLKDLSLIDVDGVIFLGYWNDGVVSQG